ncbi:hypothetical protein E2C01_067176 [Portunus trituberculatus]|uniref:Uncharacterized protein n=1 Tax=Portunus trituberculatus TaxID=210409 RepID=A0A5B7HNF1_PORTR|nr:hypothetical protein [Portunus trituberculatus]
MDRYPGGVLVMGCPVVDAPLSAVCLSSVSEKVTLCTRGGGEAVRLVRSAAPLSGVLSMSCYNF